MAKITTAEIPSYEDWMRRVDRSVRQKVGLSVHDLADFLSYDMYSDGVSPEEAADHALEMLIADLYPGTGE